MESKTRVPAAPELVWALYLVLLVALTLADTWHIPKSMAANRAWDVAILVTGLPGAAAAALFSAVLARKRATGRMAGWLAFRVAAGCFVGPIAGFIVVMALDRAINIDIDGGLLLFYMPLLAVLLAIIVPFIAMRSCLTNGNEKES